MSRMTQNSILVWEGAVQAPAGLCGGAGGRNQRGAIFNATRPTQNPHVDLVDWQFHYRDPAAKGKPNTDCTNASDPNRNPRRRLRRFLEPDVPRSVNDARNRQTCNGNLEICG